MQEDVEGVDPAARPLDAVDVEQPVSMPTGGPPAMAGPVQDGVVETQMVDGRAVVAAVGAFDYLTAPRLREALLDCMDASQRIIVDLSAVSFVDSSALGALVGAQKRLQRESGRLMLVGPSPRVLRTFELAGLTKVFDVVASLEDALRA